mmetsp:Transcript_12606/g.26698  ORF Transcript_12606/g.26698 Transcript_12606/m.26698 type:complete len:136 (-) Transcript_12606:1664-2071(-)
MALSVNIHSTKISYRKKEEKLYTKGENRFWICLLQTASLMMQISYKDSMPWFHDKENVLTISGCPDVTITTSKLSTDGFTVPSLPCVQRSASGYLFVSNSDCVEIGSSSHPCCYSVVVERPETLCRPSTRLLLFV